MMITKISGVSGQKIAGWCSSLRFGLGGLSVSAALVMAAVPMGGAIAANDYERCAADLVGLKVTPEEAASACAKALHPKEIATCVGAVAGQGVAIADALSSCNRVRRPVELGTCVTSIRGKISGTVANDVLGNCQRSLLPTEYASCVVGVNTAAKLPAVKAMDTCIDAGYYPKELHETFIPNPPEEGAAPSPKL
jgi:hypothetical protein